MRKMSPHEAVSLGRVGVQISAAGRRGDDGWGRRMRRQRGARAQKLYYPTLWPLWLENARRTRLGRPLLPVPQVDTPTAIATREGRQLKKRRDAYARALAAQETPVTVTRGRARA
jgi:hypothetical protein